MLEYKLTEPYIELHKLLKVLDLVDSGAQAKLLIAEGHLTRNGEIETRKRAKIIAGDILQIAEVTIKVVA